MSKVEQNTQIRTGRTGLTACDPEQACPGYIIYTPIAGDGTVYAIDPQGREAHRWKMPFPPGLWGYLLPNGNLFYSGKIIKDETWDRFESWNAFKGGVILEAEMDGTVVWNIAIRTITTMRGARKAVGWSIFPLSPCRKTWRGRCRVGTARRSRSRCGPM